MRSEGINFTDYKLVLKFISSNDIKVSKEELLEIVQANNKIHLHSTPNDVSQLIYNLTKGKFYTNAIDICCGTGNILYYLQQSIEDLTGIEIDNNVACLTEYYLPDVKIISANTFQYAFDKKYDLIVGNVPWGIKVQFGDKIVDSEEAFIEEALELLSDNGEAILLIPISILHQQKYTNLRGKIKSKLDLILELPQNSLPNSALKTAIIRLNKKESNEIQIGVINQIDNSKEIDSFVNKKLVISDLEESLLPTFYLNRDKKVYRELESLNTKKIKEIATIVKGYRLTNDEVISKNNFLILKPSNLDNGSLKLQENSKLINRNNLTDKQLETICLPGDIIMSTIFNELKIYIFRDEDPPSIISENLVIIRTPDNDYISSYLKTDNGKRIFSEQAKDKTIGNIIPIIKIKDLEDIEIPILPLSDLNVIGDNAIENATAEELKSLEEIIKGYINEIDHLKNENESLKINKNFIFDRFDRIEKQLEIVNTKLDSILLLVQDLSMEFKDIKSSIASPEDKLSLLCSELDSKIEILLENNIDQIKKFEVMLSKWFEFEWDKLENLSKSYLPTAELLFSQLSKIESADLSPFIIQYCRALENELLKKIFRAYVQSLIDRQINLEEKFAWDFGKKESGNFNNENTLKIVKHLKNCLKNHSDRWFFELGGMVTNLKYLTGDSLSKSPVLKDLKEFVITYFEENLLEKKFLDELNRIKDSYRNKAAHPNKITIDEAKVGKDDIRKVLKEFLEFYKS